MAVHMVLYCVPLLGITLANTQDKSDLHKRLLGGAKFEKKINCWAEWVFDYTKAHGCQAQMKPKHSFSQYLYNLARNATGVLEVGTWSGCGSTLILAKGLIDQGVGDRKLQTLEINQLRGTGARKVLAELPVVNVTIGSTSAAHDIYPLHEVNNGALPPNMINKDRKMYMDWWHGEYVSVKRLEMEGMRPVIQDLCTRNVIDVALLDGGEFFGASDLGAVLRHCPKLRYIALDDTRTFKNYRSLQKLLNHNSGWKLCAEDTAERNGWAIVGASNPAATEDSCDAVWHRKKRECMI